MPESEKGPAVEALEAVHQIQNGMSRLKYLARMGGEEARGIIAPGARVVAEELRALRVALDGDREARE